MKQKNLRSASMAALAAMLLAAPACGVGGASPGDRDRWVTTEDTTGDIDWDAIGKAYRDADGPEDFETKVNEIYAGSEIISVAVADLDASTQEVTGFIDRDASGKVDDGEAVFKIRRDVTDEGSAQYQVHGAGAYHGYHSPMSTVLMGAATGYMLGRVFSPSYAPVYSRPYVTPTTRHAALTSHRDGYRKANPSKFQNARASKTGKSYGNKGGRFGGGRSAPPPRRPRTRSRGGGRFGIAASASTRRIRLEA